MDIDDNQVGHLKPEKPGFVLMLVMLAILIVGVIILAYLRVSHTV